MLSYLSKESGGHVSSLLHHGESLIGKGATGCELPSAGALAPPLNCNCIVTLPCWREGSKAHPIGDHSHFLHAEKVLNFLTEAVFNFLSVFH